jgi:hypothetical protein
MREMFLAPWTKLTDFHPVWMNTLVFGDRVVAAFAFATRQDDGFPWHFYRFRPLFNSPYKSLV